MAPGNETSAVERPAGRLGGPFGKTREMVFPRIVLAGHAVLEEVGKTAKELGLRSPGAVITGTTTGRLAGDRVAALLKLSGYEVIVITAKEATLDEVARLDKAVGESSAAFVVGVGGGSKIDLTKMVAARRHLPFISVPTAASHDGISSPRVSLKGDREAFSLDAVVPDAIVADTAVILEAPFRLLSAGCADVISNVTAVLDWRLAQRLRDEEFSSHSAALADYAAKEIIDQAAMIKPGLEESVWIAIRPIIMSGIAMSMAGSSRPSSGSEHLFAHALERIRPGLALHGEMVGVGTIMMAHLHGIDWKAIRHALQEVGAPITAEALGASREEIITALVNAHTLRRERYTILGDSGLTPEAAARLAKVTGVC